VIDIDTDKEFYEISIPFPWRIHELRFYENMFQTFVAATAKSLNVDISHLSEEMISFLHEIGHIATAQNFMGVEGPSPEDVFTDACERLKVIDGDISTIDIINCYQVKYLMHPEELEATTWAIMVGSKLQGLDDLKAALEQYMTNPPPGIGPTIFEET
jgi:hypothetical protein